MMWFSFCKRGLDQKENHQYFVLQKININTIIEYIASLLETANAVCIVSKIDFENIFFNFTLLESVKREKEKVDSLNDHIMKEKVRIQGNCPAEQLTSI